MKKIVSILLITLLLFTSCGVNLETGENKLKAGDYVISLTTNTNYLTVFLSEDIIQAYKDSMHDGRMFFNVNSLGCASHVVFDSLEDIDNPTRWYTAVGTSSTDGSKIEGSEVFLTSENIGNYRVKVDFYLSLSDEAPMDTYSISVRDIGFPDCSVFSSIIIGTDGYQEASTFTKELQNDGYIGTISKGENRKVSIIIYIDGDDENASMDYLYTNMPYIVSHFGNISFTIDLTENN